MIIRYPTAYYADIIPKRPADSGNITYTISNEEPPRSDLLFQKIPLGIENKQREQLPIDPVVRRNTFGQLLYSVSRSSAIAEGNNSQQYNIGQVIEFQPVNQVAVDIMLVGGKTETRHDVNIVDYDRIGISEDELLVMSRASLKTQQKLVDELNRIKRLRGDAEQTINVQQKLINDINRTIKSLEITMSQIGQDDDMQMILDKLRLNLEKAITSRDKAVSDANEYASDANVILEKLRSVEVLVK